MKLYKTTITVWSEDQLSLDEKDELLLDGNMHITFNVAETIDSTCVDGDPDWTEEVDDFFFPGHRWKGC